MAGQIKIAVVSAALSSLVAGTTDLTKSGFGTPKACRVFLSFDAVDDASVAGEGKLSAGFSDFTDNFCITHQDEDGSAKVDCDSRKSNTSCYALLGIAGALDFGGTASTITDGVRLTNTGPNAPAANYFVTVVMYGGSDLKVSLDRTVVNSTQDLTATISPGAAFDTSVIYFLGVDTAAEDSSSTGINNSMGVCHINAPTYTIFTQRCIGWASDHNNNVGSPAAIIRSNRVLSILTETAGQDWGIEVTAAATNSITITTRDAGAGAGMEVYSLALDIDDRTAKVGSVDSPISGATWTPAVALGFTPQYVELGLTNLTAEDTIVSDALAGGLGVSLNSGVGEETCHSWYNEDASALANTNNLFRSRVIDLRDDDVTTVIQDHSHSSFNSGDWTYTINTENETTAKKYFYCAIEEAGLVQITLEGNQPFPTGGISLMRAFIGVAGNQPASTGGISLMRAFIGVAGNQPAPAGDLSLIKYTIPALAGNQPFPTGDISLMRAFIGLAGNQPNATGDISLTKYLIAVAGNQPFATGILTFVFANAVALFGNQPFATGDISLIRAFIGVAGNQPFPTGGISLMRAFIGVAGNQPASTGGISLMRAFIGVAGNQPAPAGDLSLIRYTIPALAGNQPFPTGDISLMRAFIGLAGNQPNATGALTLIRYLIVVAGAQPAPSGALTLIRYSRNLAGNQPAPSGNIALKYLIALAGAQPNPTGALSLIRYLIALTGAQPFPTGALGVLLGIGVVGNQPAPTGSIALLRLFLTLAGNQPAASAVLTQQFISLFFAVREILSAGDERQIVSIADEREVLHLG